MRHLIDPADFTLEETLSLMDLADRIHDDPAAYKDVQPCGRWEKDCHSFLRTKYQNPSFL